jgi:hypothetical protein
MTSSNIAGIANQNGSMLNNLSIPSNSIQNPIVSPRQLEKKLPALVIAAFKQRRLQKIDFAALELKALIRKGQLGSTYQALFNGNEPYAAKLLPLLPYTDAQLLLKALDPLCFSVQHTALLPLAAYTLTRPSS